jgi:anti-sigma B factor antagonist
MKRFGVNVERLPSGAVVLALHGELDLEHVYSFGQELHRAEETEPPCIVLDLRRLEFVDSLGIRELLSARRRAKRDRRRLVLVRGGPPIQRLLALVGLQDAFETVSEVPLELRRAPASSGA